MSEDWASQGLDMASDKAEMSLGGTRRPVNSGTMLLDKSPTSEAMTLRL